MAQVTPNLITFSSTISACEKLGRAAEVAGCGWFMGVGGIIQGVDL